MVKTAIISFEHMHAYSYAEALEQSPNTQFTAFFEQDAEKFLEIKNRYPKAKAYRSYKELLNKADCEAVIVTSANARHREHVLACAQAGKHILCEKPIATTLKDAQKMIESCRRAGVKLQMAFPVRFSPAVTRAKTVLSKKELGRILAAKTTNHGSMPGGWFIDKKLSGGGAIMDHTVHVADLVRYLLKEEFVEVYAEKATRLNPIKVEDCGLLMLKLSGGSFVSLDASWSRPPSYKIWGDVTLEIKGARANLFIDCFPRILHLYQNATMKHATMSGGNNLDLALIEDFTDCVSSDREPGISGEDGLRALEVAVGAYRSLREKRPVTLPL